MLKQLFQAVKPGGGVLITVPQHRFLWSRQDEYACHVRRYEPSELEDKVLAAGFTLVRSTSFVTLLTPLMLMSRWRKQKRAGDFDPLDELRLGAALNGALGQVMKLEATLIRSGLNMPFGGSRLVLATRRDA